MQDMDITNHSELVDLITKIVLEKMGKRPEILKTGYHIPVGVSNRHMHVTREALDVLFGKGHELTGIRNLSQPGEFASKETVTVIGPKMRGIENVRILGPIRSACQVELSMTDGVYLGLDLPIRISGDLEGSMPITVIGPKGVVHLKGAAIRAARHIHMTPRDANVYGLKTGDIVQVEVPGEAGVIFQNVHIRVSENYKLDFHIDTDEGNSARVKTGDLCRIVRQEQRKDA